MAEQRFPSIEGFEAGQTSPAAGQTSTTSEDFLSREKAALGDDANQFSTPSAGFNATVDEAEEDDLLGGGPPTQPATAAQDIHGFESSFPSIDVDNENVAPGGTITGLDSFSARTTTPSIGVYEAEEETEPMKQWRVKRDADIEKREAAAAEKREAKRDTAVKWVDSFYEQYNSKKDKSVAKTQKEQEEFFASQDSTTSGGTSWDRIAKLVDLQTKGEKGGEREKFRELLTNLKKDESAPGAKGV
ncbi:MAG: hypothetical protein M1814_005162 [Vezdaea aestivalis]|nr:MAG: hypothetical protein M1814_005162 [Vezdaea aestivalis]